ncbi:SpoIIE family protein phosphatase [Nocardioides sp. W3-2-3]|nr:SpoIIE family protein phosphatase [Nocardioides convexus]
MLAASGFAYGGDFIVSDLAAATGRLQAGARRRLRERCHGGARRGPVRGGAGEPAGRRTGRGAAGRREHLPAAPALRGEHGDGGPGGAGPGDGEYLIRSAGHPPALRWSAHLREWEVDNARGTALGACETPEVVESAGVLAPGEALMFYTDGVVESRSLPMDDGIAWLRETARTAVAESLGRGRAADHRAGRARRRRPCRAGGPAPGI